MAEEYHIVSFRKTNGDEQKMLVHSNEFKNAKAEGMGMEYFCDYGATEITDHGIVQITGDTHLLDNIYKAQ